MDKLRFHDNDGQIIDELLEVHAKLHELYARPALDKSSFIDDVYNITHDDIKLLTIASDIIAGDWCNDGSYIFTVCSKYVILRTIDYARLRFIYAKAHPFICTPDEEIVYAYMDKLLGLLDYILKYSYRANKKVKPAKVPKRPKTNGVLTPKIHLNRKYLNKDYKTLNKEYVFFDTDNVGGVFDDYPSFIGSFARPNPIPCDGDDK